MNAGYSAAGSAFALRNCEFLLTSLIDVECGRRDVEEIREAAGRFTGARSRWSRPRMSSAVRAGRGGGVP